MDAQRFRCAARQQDEERHHRDEPARPGHLRLDPSERRRTESAAEAEHGREQQAHEDGIHRQAPVCRGARRRDVAENHREQRPVDEVVDDRGAHDQRTDRPGEQTEVHQNPGDDRIGGVGQVHPDEEGEREEVRLDRRPPEASRQAVDQRHAGGNWQHGPDQPDEDRLPAQRLQVREVDLESGIEQEEQHPELGRRVADRRDVRGREEQPLVDRRRQPSEDRRPEDDPAQHLSDDRRLLESPHQFAEQDSEPEHRGQLERQLDEILRGHARAQMRREPLPRFGLHLEVELVRGVVQPASLTVGRRCLSKARLDLSKRFLDSVRRKQRVFRPVDDQERTRSDQRGEIREIKVAVQAGNVERQPDRVEDMPPDGRRECRHPADVDGRFDPRIERGQQEAAIAADRQADTGQALPIDFGTAGQVVERPQVVPQHHAGPGDSRGHQASRDELLVLARSPVEGGHVVGCHPLWVPIRWWILVEQHPALAPIEHVDGDDDIAAAHELGRDALAVVEPLLEFREHGMLVLDCYDFFLAPDVEAAVVSAGAPRPAPGVPPCVESGRTQAPADPASS